MSESEIREQVRRKIEKRMEERQGFIIHFVAYSVINTLMWVVIPLIITNVGFFDNAEFENFVTTFGPIIPLVISFGWGIGLFAHFMDYYYKYGGGAQRRENQIEREVQYELARKGLAKRKNEDLYLSDDGELEYAEYNEDEQQALRR